MVKKRIYICSVKDTKILLVSNENYKPVNTQDNEKGIIYFV